MEQLAGRSLLELLHEDDVAAMRFQLECLAQGRETAPFENRVRGADGTYRWLLWSAVPIPRERIFYATARDITDRRRMEQALLESRNALESRVHERTAELMESEARARQIVDTALDSVVTMDAAGKITGWNLRAESMFGWTREEAIGRDLAETIIPPSYREAHRRGLQRFIATGHGNILGTRIELEALYRSGRVFPVELAITPLQRGGEWTFSAFVRDITRRKQAEQALRAGEEKIRLANVQLEERVRERTVQLETANKELESFSYSVSHDLRAPLRHVQGYVEMLNAAARDQLTDKARRYLKVISDASGEMGQLIDDLLAFSRMARAEIREAPVDVAALAREIVAKLEMEARGRAIEWRIGSVPPMLGDAAMVRQVLANLLGNAAKYTRGRDPAVIELGFEGEDEGRGVVFVRDNGAGFDMQYVHKLFGVFQRLHRSEDFEGTGIGLASVRRIVARHGGRVWAEGELGKGATFRFTLRLAEVGRGEASQNAA
jgi:PAS domain S-box-containing protein